MVTSNRARLAPMAVSILRNHVIDVALVVLIATTVGGCLWARSYYDSVFLEDRQRADAQACGVIDDAIGMADQRTATATHGLWHGSAADSKWCAPYTSYSNQAIDN